MAVTRRRDTLVMPEPAASFDGYAVVDVETTGLNPCGHDRVIEVAVVQLSPDGRTAAEWSTLINPDRDLGPQRVHRIHAADLIDAPRFPQIAPTLAQLLTGRLLCAHHAGFDARFLAEEFRRAGVAAPIDPDRALCTMRLSRDYLPTSVRTLAACCAAAGVVIESAHEALADARAAAGLLRCYLAVAGDPLPWAQLAAQASTAAWPVLPTGPSTRAPVHRGNRTGEPASAWLRRLRSRSTGPVPQAAGMAYLTVLDGALLDRFLSQTAKNRLVAVADEHRLSRSQVLWLHESYLAGVAHEARSPAAAADLVNLAALLGLDETAVERALTEARHPPSGCSAATSPSVNIPVQRGTIALRPGDRVVLTGEMDQPRELWELMLRSAGLTTGGVTKATRVVVAADPDSTSGKALRAAQYGIPIVSEGTFSRLFDAYLTSLHPV